MKLSEYIGNGIGDMLLNLPGASCRGARPRGVRFGVPLAAWVIFVLSFCNVFRYFFIKHFCVMTLCRTTQAWSSDEPDRGRHVDNGRQSCRHSALVSSEPFRPASLSIQGNCRILMPTFILRSLCMWRCCWACDLLRCLRWSKVIKQYSQYFNIL